MFIVNICVKPYFISYFNELYREHVSAKLTGFIPVIKIPTYTNCI